MAPSLSVKHAKTADSATNATTATNAANATNASNATNLGGVPATGYFKAANAQADGFAASANIPSFTASTYTDIASKTFTAPTSGFIFVIGTLSTEDDLGISGSGDLFYRLALDGTGLTTDPFYHEIASDSTTNFEVGAGQRVLWCQ